MIPLNNSQILKEREEKKFNLFENKNNNKNSNLDSESELKNKSNFKTDGIIEYVFIKFSNSVRLIGPLFAFCLVMFVIVVSNTVFNYIIPYWNKNFHVIFGLMYFFIAVYLLFSILFNYFLAVFVKPGSLNDISNSKFYRKNDPLNFSNNKINFENNKLLENLNNLYNEGKSKNELSSSNIKLRFKTNENSHLNINQNKIINSNENLSRHEDLKTISDLTNYEVDNINECIFLIYKKM